MKPILLFVSISLFLTVEVLAQKFESLDNSPLDISYYPNNYAHDRRFAPELIGEDVATIRIIYSRPAKKDREVFGKLIPFRKVWRTGANEAPEIKLYRDLTLGGKTVKAGTYTLFTIPDQAEWTFILNSELDDWGAYNYKEEKDIVRFKVPVKTIHDTIENFSIQFEKSGAQSAVMRLGWDHTIVEVPIGLK